MSELILDKLQQFAPESIEGSGEYRGELTILVRKDDIVRIARYLKDDPDLAFDLLKDVCGVDMLRPEARYEVVYHLYSLKIRSYLRLKVRVEEENAVVPTVTGVWPGAEWHERETYDMFGIKFSGHPDLRRLYMPEDFEHHPLRKDFPLMGAPDSLPLPRR
jgi:NADH-quinone oxidoreductase subunit C